jgi:hypothetical protein
MLTFSISGQIGGLNGINAAGLAVTTTLLLDCPRRNTTAVGKVHPVIVKRVLESSGDIETAVEAVRSLPRTGAWSLCLSQHARDRVCYLEYDGDRLAVRHDVDRLVSANHCLLLDRVEAIPEHSRLRQERLEALLAFERGAYLEPGHAQVVLRDRFDSKLGRIPRHPTKNTIRRVDNQASIVMLPARGEVWITPGPMAPDRENEYFCLHIDQLLKAKPATKVA